ncbi:predicted protein [Nematostella vectensis]|uniref:Uncharacterized protein n=1 Tax=Nematostella vectensis TaxID=45351 RepID=A7RQU8_NEMVE|nr:predicted protein [Nematostella vectensis]|eukprot:XP_001638293.1 predicted protein [Nematostella vectensis]
MVILGLLAKARISRITTSLLSGNNNEKQDQLIDHVYDCLLLREEECCQTKRGLEIKEYEYIWARLFLPRSELVDAQKSVLALGRFCVILRQLYTMETRRFLMILLAACLALLLVSDMAHAHFRLGRREMVKLSRTGRISESFDDQPSTESIDYKEEETKPRRVDMLLKELMEERKRELDRRREFRQ